MEEGDKTQGVFFILADALIFIFAVIVVVTLAATGIGINYDQAYRAGENTTITQNDRIEQEFSGHSQNGNIVYDGVMTGDSVYTDILTADPSIDITISGINLSGKHFTTGGRTYGYLEYNRDYDSMQIIRDGFINMKRNYRREYTVTDDGTTIAIRYTPI